MADVHTKYSDGLIMLASSSVQATMSEVSSVTGGVKTTYTVNINAQLTGYSGCTCTISNLKYRIDTSSYDSIISQGTAVPGSKCTSTSLSIVRATETSSQNAKFVANIDYQFGNTGYSTCGTTLTLEVGNNRTILNYQNDEGW